MTFDRSLIYGLAALLIAIGLFKRSNSLRARKITGNVVVGGNRGTINQSYHADRETPVPPPAKPDHVAWWIMIIGVLIAAAQLAHDVLAK